MRQGLYPKDAHRLGVETVIKTGLKESSKSYNRESTRNPLFVAGEVTRCRELEVSQRGRFVFPFLIRSSSMGFKGSGCINQEGKSCK